MNLSLWWKQWQRRLATPSRRTQRVRPADAETVECRQLLSASALFLPATGELSIELDSTDSVRITSVAGTLSVTASTNGGAFLPVNSIGSVPAANVVSINVLGGDDGNTIDMGGVTAAAFTSLTSIVADGANGHDLIIGSVDLPDSLIGGNGQDTIQGQGGNDTIAGGDGADSILAGTGDDSISSGDGNDSVFGEDGNDTISAGNGQDTVSGGNGNDSVSGFNGQDSLLGDDGDDTINGDGGVDTVDGGAGNDSILGGEFDDSLLGGDGNDTILGQGGADNIDGQAGDDSALGGAGNDSVIGGAGNDTLSGDAGNDTVDGSDGNDRIFGGAGNDVGVGGLGDDTLSGQGGNDTVNGGSGNDLVDGGTGDDLVFADDLQLAIVQSFTLDPEGTGGTTVMRFNVALSAPAFATTTVAFTTVDGTAVAGQDYIATSGTVTFQAGQSLQTIDVTIITDGVDENDETFSIVLSNPQNALLVNAVSNATIVDDDSLDIVVNDVSIVEGATALAGPAIRPGFTANTLAGNDDGSTGTVPIGFTMNFFGTNRSNLFVNNNGNVTFTSSLFTFTPFPILTTGTPIIAPFFADVDTRAATSQPVTYGTGTVNGRTAFGVDWINVGHFSQGTPLNSFQMIIIDRSDVAPGDFDLEFNYDQILWEAGTASGSNAQGLGGSSARVGFSNGTNVAYEFPGSAINGALLDGGPPATSLIQNSLNSGVLGRYIFQGRSGNLNPVAGVTAQFTVSLTNTSVNPVTVNYSTSDGTANSIQGNNVGLDYLNTSGTLTFAPGVTSQTVNITVGSDVQIEPDETFFLNLTNPVGANIGDPQGLGTILNDDGPGANPGPGGATPPPVIVPPVSSNRIVVSGLPTFTGSSSAFSDTLLGSDGNDTIIGSGGNDFINGGAGADSLNGSGGNDSILGGAGNDTLDGSAGDDTLDGQGGNDVLIGGDGNDTFVEGNGAGGNDTVEGGNGFNQIVVNGTNSADTITVGQSSGRVTVTRGGATITAGSDVQSVIVNALGGDDTVLVNDLSAVATTTLVIINGGDGNDFIKAFGANLGTVRLGLNGDAGNDSIHGSNGNDSINGGSGNDQINGQGGNDTITGSLGDDILAGGLGNDTVNGGDGNDFMTGQDGDDSLIGGDGNDTLRGFAGNDTLLGVVGDDLLNGMDGDDSILGGVGQDSISGGSGNDTLDGGRNDDTINGNAGNDNIRGDHGHDYIATGTESDTVNGGDGNDTIIATDGNDLLAGNDGDDNINAGSGNDTLSGGDGNDTLLGGSGSDQIVGGDGDDNINGQGGSDTIAGNQGIDTIADPSAEINEQFQLPASILAQLDG